jgi:Putative Flp pilus-assembly TadE/G-like
MVTKAPGRQDGQILVLFTLALVAIVAMVGLVLDGGSAYAQRRGQQNAADLAALAGADALINGHDATAAARAVTKANGYENGKNNITVAITFPAVNQVKVDIGAPHQNYFAGVVGQPTWQVGVTATAEEGVPVGGVIGAAPIIFSDGVFGSNDFPTLAYGCATYPTTPCAGFAFTKTTGDPSDYPTDATHMAWTNLGTGNVSSDDVKNALDGTAPVTNPDLTLNDYIGQQNNGVHNTLFDTNSAQQPSVNTVLAGQDVVVPIIGEPISPATTCNSSTETTGCFRGWALFHVVSATKLGGSFDGTVTGYFISGFSRSVSSSSLCTDGPACEGFHGLYSLRLIN